LSIGVYKEGKRKQNWDGISKGRKKCTIKFWAYENNRVRKPINQAKKLKN